MKTDFNGSRRVVITGAGAITPCGLDVETFWNSLVAGKSGLHSIERFDASDLPCRIAGEIMDFDPLVYMTAKEARRSDRFVQFALGAAFQAYADAGLKTEQVDPDRFSVVIGTGSGGIGTIETQMHEVYEKGVRRCSPFFIPMMICDMAAGRVSIEFNAQGPNMAIVTACATGTDALGNAYRMIQNNEADIAFAGGAEATINQISLAGFCASRAVSFQNDRPEAASRPFDVARDGFVMGEGATILILEELSHAQRRGARIYGEMVGYGRSSDAYDIVSPPSDGRGAAKAMRAALRDAALSPSQVQYLNAHATSTPVGDRAEANAIETVFETHATGGPLLVSSTKSMTGHMMGAAGAAEALICLLALRDQTAPPTMNVDDKEPDCHFDIIPNRARVTSGLKVAMSNSFGFGGHNASLIVQQFQP